MPPFPSNGMMFGSCVRDITPSMRVPLAGFAHRKNLSDRIHSRLYLRAFAFEDVHSKRRAAVVAADIIGWDVGLASRIETVCQERFRTDCVILSATHTHSGPCVLPLHGSLQSVPDSGYMKFLAEQAVAAVGEACAHFEVAQIRRCSAETSGLVVSRRLMTDEGIVARPSEAGQSDRELIVWKFQRPDEDVLAVWIHYACHPTILSGDDISSEYMGSVVQAVESELKGVVCAFFQGCAGDVRPYFTDGRGNFKSTKLKDLEEFSRAMTKHVKDALVAGGVLAKDYDVRTENRAFVAHARPADGLSRTISVDVPICAKGLKFARNVGVIAFPGEPSVAYQQTIKSRSGGGILPLGYCNGFPGYLPTARQIREGGYESALSCPLFGLPGPFDESLEAGLLREAEALTAIIKQ